MILEPVDAPLSDEDRDAAERLHAHLSALGPWATTVRVIVSRLGGICAVRAYAGDHYGSQRVESVATATTVGAALCEAARRIGVAL